MGFYTGFANGEIFDALYNFCDPGENGENIRYWHSSSTDQDRTVLSESDEDLESFPKAGRPRFRTLTNFNEIDTPLTGLFSANK